MNHLRIQVLGPFAIWDVRPDGWHDLEIKGDTGRAILAALIFKGTPTWTELTRDIWGALEVDNARKRYNANRRKGVERLREDLQPYEGILKSGSRFSTITGRQPDEVPQRVFIDWDDLVRYQKEKEYAKALSLVLGRALSNMSDIHGDFGGLVTDIRQMVEEAVERSLVELKKPIPNEIVLDAKLLSDYWPLLPDEWKIEPPPSPPISSPSPSVTKPVKRRRPPHHFGSFAAEKLFEPCYEGRERLGRERDEAAMENRELSWPDEEWFGNFFAYWFKTLTIPCGEIAITYLDDCYDSARFSPRLKVDAPERKATIIDASSLFSESIHEIVCGTTNWGFAHIWAKDNAARILRHPSNPSVFGVRGRPVYPGIAGVHTLVLTNDKYVLFALRSPTVDFHRLSWSASFEESISVDSRKFTGPSGGDKTVLDVIEGGLYEEWGIEEDAIIDTTCLAIGREWVREPHQHGYYLNLSSTVLTACLVNLSLKQVWASLKASGGIRDRHEHRAWAGCRFAQRDDVLRFMAAAVGHNDNTDLLRKLSAQPDINAHLEFFPSRATTGLRDRGLMPTSAARLALASAWFCTLGLIDN